MDPKVCGKLLMLHRRGNGVDAEALRDRFPLRQIAGKGPKMGSHGYRRLRRGKSGFVPPLVVGIRVYIGERTRSVELRGSHEGGGHAYPLGAPSCLVSASWRSRLQLQNFWFAFGPRKTIAKVSLRLHSV